MMRTRLWGIGIVLFGCVAAIGCVTYGYRTVSSGPPATVVAPADGSDQPFFDDLTPYGRWVFVTGPGWVWSPYNVQVGWRPYQLGHWVFTDYGWTWASDEEWGWAVYHYGRWHLDASIGWVWVPGTEWGPAWVAWHEGGGYVGWAPLPWQVRVQAGVGLDWATVNVTIAPSWWCFVGTRHLVDPGLRTHIVPASRNVTLIKVTQNVTNYTYIDNRVVNQGVKVEKIGRAVGHTVPRYRVAETDSPELTRGGKVRGSEFVVFRPDPPRGRKAQGRVDPRGHDERDRARDLRQAAEEAQRQSGPAPSQPEPAPQAPAPSDPAATTHGHETKDHGHEPQQSRGRRLLDELMGKPPARHSPQGNVPAQPAAPNHPSGATAQPSGPTTPSAETGSQSPASGDPQGASTAPSRPGQTKSQAAKEQAAKEKAKAARDAASKARKPKSDAPKSGDSDPNKSKAEKPDSGD